MTLEPGLFLEKMVLNYGIMQMHPYTINMLLLVISMQMDTPKYLFVQLGRTDGSPQGWVTALTHDGQIFAKVHTYFPCYGGLSLGDTNNDGVYELFMGERNIGYDGNVVGKGVRAFWASNLTERWCHPEMLSSSHCPTLVDTNKDGILEVVCPRSNRW